MRDGGRSTRPQVWASGAYQLVVWNQASCRSSSRGSADKEELFCVQGLAGEWVRRRCEEALVLPQPEERLAREEAHGEDTALTGTQRRGVEGRTARKETPREIVPVLRRGDREIDRGRTRVCQSDAPARYRPDRRGTEVVRSRLHLEHVRCHCCSRRCGHQRCGEHETRPQLLHDAPHLIHGEVSPRRDASRIVTSDVPTAQGTYEWAFLRRPWIGHWKTPLPANTSRMSSTTRPTVSRSP